MRASGTGAGAGTVSREARSIQIARIPAACAPAMSRARLSPIMTASFGAISSEVSAASKMRGSGFPAPISAEMTVISKNEASAVRESFSLCTSGAPLVTSASRWSRARSRTTAAASGSTSWFRLTLLFDPNGGERRGPDAKAEVRDERTHRL